jgi:predicted ATPase/transcriptional regulator with XRE-family HTH domain
VRKRRRALDLTQAQLGRLAACTESAIRKIEGDERRPSRRIAERLADALRIARDERARFVAAARGEQAVQSLAEGDASGGVKGSVDLPPGPARLIGRDADLGLIEQRLADPSCRLLTISGPGGVGKTRLAVAACARASPLFADGTWTVFLAETESKDVLLSALAHAVGLSLSSDADAQTQLHAYLRGRQALLLLDNFEHLLAATQTVAALLDAAPRVKILVTSRERLNLSEEWLLPLGGLKVANEAADVQEVVTCPAVQLFAERAVRVRPDFSQHLGELLDAARVCRLVKGSPLAIELAATWARLHPCREILREIERNLDLLRSSARDTPARHASLRAAFDYSMGLLDDQERGVLARLSAFRAPFDRDAAARVCDASLPMLAGLSDKSLLRSAGEGRFAMHELLRQFAAELRAQQPAEQGRAEERHGRYFLTLVIEQRDRLVGPGASAAVEQLSVVLPDLRAALHWALQAGEHRLAASALANLYWVYELGGRYGEGTELVEGVKARLGADPLVDTERTRASLASLAEGMNGWLLLQIGCYAEALEVSRRAVARLRRHAPIFELQMCLATVAIAAGYTGRAEEARAALDEVRRNPAPEARPGWDVQLRLALALAYTALDELGEAERELRLALAALAPLGQPWLLGSVHYQLSNVALRRNRLEEAQQHAEHAMAAWQRLHRRHPYLVLGEVRLGRMALKRGDLGAARNHFERSLEQSQSMGYAPYIAHAHAHLGRIDAAEGRHEEALRRHCQALDVNRELGNRLGTVRSLLHCASALKSVGQVAQAYANWHEAALLALDGRMMELARQALGELAALARAPVVPQATSDVEVLRHQLQSLPPTFQSAPD